MGRISSNMCNGARNAVEEGSRTRTSKHTQIPTDETKINSSAHSQKERGSNPSPLCFRKTVEG